MIDYWTLQFIASFLLIVGFTRTLTLKVPWSLWHLTTYTLVLLIASVGILLFQGLDFRIEVFFVGLAFVSGLTWTGLAQEHKPIPHFDHLVSAGGALLVTSILTFLALNYQWWTAPLIVLGLIGVAFVRDFIVVPTVDHVRKRRGLAPIDWSLVGAPPEEGEESALSSPAKDQPVGPGTSTAPDPLPPSRTVHARKHQDGRYGYTCPRCLRPGHAGSGTARVRCAKCGSQLQLKT